MIPDKPKLYHIVHMNTLASIINDGWIFPDSEVSLATSAGTSIGMTHIKSRRMRRRLQSHPDLTVGQCVPFYFCPRSVMLRAIHRNIHGTRPDLPYRGGQEYIAHLEADLYDVVRFANRNRIRWAFTNASAASNRFEDYKTLADLNEIDWLTITSNDWERNYTEKSEVKQAEFLLGGRFPWTWILRIGVISEEMQRQVMSMTEQAQYRPSVIVRPDWYYWE